MEIDKFINLASEAWDNSDKTLSRDYLHKAWELIPTPKELHSDSYLICDYLVKVNLELKDLDSALNWVNKLQLCDLDRMDCGEREFIHGKVIYEKGDIEKAKLLFEIANQKSSGLCFTGENKKYEDLIKYGKTSSSFEDLKSKAEYEFQNKNFSSSINYFFDCLNYSKGLSDSFIYLRKGQCHFELNDLDNSADDLTRAYMLS